MKMTQSLLKPSFSILSLLMIGCLVLFSLSCSKEKELSVVPSTSSEVSLRGSGPAIGLNQWEQRIVDELISDFQTSNDFDLFEKQATEWHLGELVWDVSLFNFLTDGRLLVYTPYVRDDNSIDFALRFELDTAATNFDIIRIGLIGKVINPAVLEKIDSTHVGLKNHWLHVFDYMDAKYYGTTTPNRGLTALGRITESWEFPNDIVPDGSEGGVDELAICVTVFTYTSWEVVPGYGCPGEPDYEPPCYELEVLYDIYIEECPGSKPPPGGGGGGGGGDNENPSPLDQFHRIYISYLQNILGYHSAFNDIWTIFLKYRLDMINNTNCSETIVNIKEFVESNLDSEGELTQGAELALECLMSFQNIHIAANVDCDAVNSGLSPSNLLAYQSYFEPLGQNGIDASFLDAHPEVADQVCEFTSIYGGTYNASIPGIVSSYSSGVAGNILPTDALLKVHDMLEVLYPNSAYSDGLFNWLLQHWDVTNRILPLVTPNQTQDLRLIVRDYLDHIIYDPNYLNVFRDNIFEYLNVNSFLDSPTLNDFQNDQNGTYLGKLQEGIIALRAADVDWYADFIEQLILCEEFETVGDLRDTWYMVKDFISEYNQFVFCAREQEAVEYLMAIYSPETIGTILGYATFGPNMSQAYRAAFRVRFASTAKKLCLDLTKGFDTFEDFKAVHGNAGSGKAWHHIVEQNQIGYSAFNPKMVHHPDNLIQIQAGASSWHSRINSAYIQHNLYPDIPLNTSLRVWLRGKPFETHYEWGLRVMKDTQ